MEQQRDHSNLFVFSGGNKAGMQGIDKQRQAQIIYESSKNSEYFKRAQEQDQKVQAKANIMISAISKMTPSQITHCKTTVTKKMVELELRRDLSSRICCVIDMDMFYAAVEIRDNPKIKDLPVAVGGLGMISTANYIARTYGVRSAMPGFIAKKLCPNLVFVEPNFEKYEKVSNQVRQIISEYDPNYQSFSMDEMYLNLKPYVLQRLGYSNTINNNNNNDISALTTTSTIATSSTTTTATTTTTTTTVTDTATASGTTAITTTTTATGTTGTTTTDNTFNKDDSSTFPTTSINHNNTVTESIHTLQKLKSPKVSPIKTNQSSTNDTNEPNILILRKVAVTVLEEIRQRVYEVTKGLTCSAGMANNFMLAKICSDFNKPNGQYELAPNREIIMEFMSNLPCRKVGGIGKVTENLLASMNMNTMGQVRTNLHEVVFAYLPAITQFLIRACVGISDDEGMENVPPPEPRKSMGAERTFSTISDPTLLREKLKSICELVVSDLKNHNLYGHAITLKLKTTDFILYTRTATLRKYSQNFEDLYPTVLRLLDAMLPISIRLMGVSVSKFKNSVVSESATTNNLLNFFHQKGSFSSSSSVSPSNQLITTSTIKSSPHTSPNPNTNQEKSNEEKTGDNDEDNNNNNDDGEGEGECYIRFQSQEDSDEENEENEEKVHYLPISTNSHQPISTINNKSSSSGSTINGGKTNLIQDFFHSSSTTTTTTTLGSTTTATNTVSLISSHECPVCGREINGTFTALNKHVDDCLSSSSSTYQSANATTAAVSSTIGIKRRSDVNNTKTNTNINKFFSIKKPATTTVDSSVIIIDDDD